MRRRAADFRRPVRRRFSCWIWVLLGTFIIAGFLLFVVHHNHHHEDHVEQPILLSNDWKCELLREGFKALFVSRASSNGDA